MRPVLLSFLFAACCAAAAPAAFAGVAAKGAAGPHDPEALRVIASVAGHFERASLVEAEVTLGEGLATTHMRLRRQAAVGVEIQAPDVHLLVRGDSVWMRPTTGDAWAFQKGQAMDAAGILAELDRSAVPLTAASLRAWTDGASSVRALGALPDEAGCAMRGVLLEQAGGQGAPTVQLELRVCADDLHPVGARLRRIGEGAPVIAREEAVYTLHADAQLADPGIL